MVTPGPGDWETVTSLALGSFLVLTFNTLLLITCNNKKNIWAPENHPTALKVEAHNSQFKFCHVLRTGIYIASLPPLGHYHSLQLY
jgi:hypothetical protein